MRFFNGLSSLLIVMVIILFVMASGCNDKNQNSGRSLASINMENEGFGQEQISLDSAIGAMNSDDGLRMGRKNYSIHNIIGRNLTLDGRASIWIISVNSDEPFIFVYNRGVIRTMQYSEEKKDAPIDFGEVLTPSELFIKQKNLISILTDRGRIPIDELELRNRKYFIRGIQPGDMWEQVFDSVTGRDLIIY